LLHKKFLDKDFIEKVMNRKVPCSYFFVLKINNYICFISWNAKKKLLELTMAASDENALKLDNLLDKEDSFNTLVNEKLKKINKKKYIIIFYFF
jgi:hypothetical protein